MKLGLISILLLALPACAAGSLDASGGPVVGGDDGSVLPQSGDGGMVSDTTTEAPGDDSAMPPTDDSSDTSSPTDDSSPPVDTGLPDAPLDVMVPPLDAMQDGGSDSPACDPNNGIYFIEYTLALTKDAGNTFCFFVPCSASQCCFPDPSDPLALCVAK